MTNKNKKIVKKAKEKARKKERNKKIKKFINMIVFNFGLFICFICLPIIFLVISFDDDSAFFAFLLAIFSFITTFVFEILEWKRGKPKNKYIVMIIIPSIFLILLAVLCVINKSNPNIYAKIINYSNKATHLPNIVTTATFLVYFISVFCRIHSSEQ